MRKSAESFDSRLQRCSICGQVAHDDGIVLPPWSFGFVIYLVENAIIAATIKMFTNAISKKKSQPRRIS